MKKMKMRMGIGLITSVMLLSACHESPIKTHSKRQTIEFLRQAAISAEKTMNLPARKKGRFYSNCMEGNIESIDCKRFFSAMLAFAKTNKDFQHLTYLQLTDAKTYDGLAEDYQDKLFNTIDDD
ncbi:MAG: hypothetical protein H0U75_10050 [Legionella sp.]|nr:hypothetical protein [Legionella sp.]